MTKHKKAGLSGDLPIQYRVVTREERLEAIAKDIVSHFMGRGYRGKAMVISIDKATAVKMYDKVQKHWESYVEELQGKLRGTTADGEGQALQDRIRYMKETDMAVVVSQSQNEIGDLRDRGVDITPHRQRMVTEDFGCQIQRPGKSVSYRFRLCDVDDWLRRASLLDDLSGQTTA